MNPSGLFTYLKIKLASKPILISSLVGLAMGILLFLSSTAIIYINNSNEFIPYDYLDFIPILVKYAAVTFLLTTLVLVIIPRSLHIFLTTLLTLCAFFAWFHSTVLVWDYGILNGVEVIWKNKQSYVYIDIILWTCLLTIIIAQFRSIYKKIIPISVLFIILQISLVIPALSSVHKNGVTAVQDEKQKIVVDNSREFDFGNQTNVLIFVLDSFGGDIFKEVLKKNPEYEEVLDGFINYENSLAGFPTTYYTPTLMLTGKYYDQSLPIQEFIETSFDNDSLPLILKEQGFLVHIPIDSTIMSSRLISSNYVYSHDKHNKHLQADTIELKRGVFNLLYPAYFRLSPAFTKKYVWYWGEQRVPLRSRDRLDYEYIQNFTKKSQVIAGENTFKFIHLWGMHPPYTVNENYNFEPMVFNQTNIFRKALLNLKYMHSVIATLKDLGIYDNTIIMFLGDHGFGDTEVIAKSSNPLLSGSIPLVAIKWLEERGPMKTSKAPVSLSAITPSVLHSLGHDTARFTTRPIQVLSENDAGDRYFYSYNADTTLWEKDYGYDMKEFNIVGDSRDENSWHYTGRTLSKNGIKNISKYRLGETVVFQKGTGQETFLSYGWSDPEESFTWSNRTMSGLTLQTDKPSSDVILRLTLHPFTYPGIVEFQTVIVELNNNDVTQFTVDKPGIYEIILSRDYFNDATQNLVLKMPKAARVSYLVKGSSEHRALGIGIVNFSLVPL